MEKPIIPVVVLQYGNFDLTRDCIASLRAQDGVEVLICLVDGCSPARTPEILESLAALADRHMFLEKNLGFAGGNNAVLKDLITEDFDCFFVLNNDTLLKHDTLHQLYQSFKRHPQAAQICPLIFYGDGTVQGAGGTIKESLFEPGMIGNQEKSAAAYQTERQVTFASGCAVLVSTVAVRKVGLIPEEYFMYCEDVDWSLRFTTAGYEIWYTPEAEVIHFESVGSGTYSTFKGFYLVRAQVMLAKTWLDGQKFAQYVGRTRAKLLRQSAKYARHPQYVLAMWRGFHAGLSSPEKKLQ